MSKQSIGVGNSVNDGTGDTLRQGAIKVNSNFTELYETFGDATNLVSYAKTSGISSDSNLLGGQPKDYYTNASNINSGKLLDFFLPDDITADTIHSNFYGPLVGDVTGNVVGTAETANIAKLAQGLTGSPDIAVGFATGTFIGNLSGTASLASLATTALYTPYARNAGISSLAEVAGIATTAEYAIKAGVTSALETTRTIGGINFNGTIDIDLPGVNIAGNQDTSGNALTATTAGYATSAGTAGYATTAGISTLSVNSQGLTGSPDINVSNITAGVVTATEFVGSGASLTGVVAQSSGQNIRRDGVAVGVAVTMDFGFGITITDPVSGISTVNVAYPGINTSANSNFNFVGISSATIGSLNATSVDSPLGYTQPSTYQDNVKLNLGTDGETMLFMDGTNTRFRQKFSGNSGDIIFDTDEANSTIAKFNRFRKSVELYYNNTLCLETKNGGVEITGVTTSTGGFVGNLTGDVSGNASGLTGTPQLNVGILTATTGFYSGNLDVTGETYLRDGVQVTGTQTVSGLSTFSSGISVNGHIANASDSDTSIKFPEANTISFETNGSEKARIDTNGQIGIGTDAPAEQLHLFNSSGSTIRVHTTGINSPSVLELRTPASGRVDFRALTGDPAGRILYSHVDDSMRFSTKTSGGSRQERVWITSDGILPASDSQYNIGLDTNRFATVYADAFNGNGSGLTGLNASPNCKQTIYSTATSISVPGQGSFAAMPFSVDITPTSASSKFLIEGAIFADSFQYDYAFLYGIRRTVGGVDTNIIPAGSGFRQGSLAVVAPYTNLNYRVDQATIDPYLDAPNTTSTVTYRFVVRNQTTSAYDYYINRDSFDGDNSTSRRTWSRITVTEVK